MPPRQSGLYMSCTESPPRFVFNGHGYTKIEPLPLHTSPYSPLWPLFDVLRPSTTLHSFLPSSTALCNPLQLTTALQPSTALCSPLTCLRPFTPLGSSLQSPTTSTTLCIMQACPSHVTKMAQYIVFTQRMRIQVCHQPVVKTEYWDQAGGERNIAHCTQHPTLHSAHCAL